MRGGQKEKRGGQPPDWVKQGSDFGSFLLSTTWGFYGRVNRQGGHSES